MVIRAYLGFVRVRKRLRRSKGTLKRWSISEPPTHRGSLSKLWGVYPLNFGESTL